MTTTTTTVPATTGTTVARRSFDGSISGSLSAMTKKPKRRNERNILTFYEKIAVIRYYDETNVSRNSLAKMFHCCTTQIRRILERKHDLLQQLATLSEADASIIIEEMTRKRRKFEMSAISFILHQWVQRCRLLQLRKAITNQTLKEVALKMAAVLNLPTFRPSYRWLNRFRAKYKYNDEDLGVGLYNENAVSGELSVEDIIIEFKDALPSFMQKEISTITQQTQIKMGTAENDSKSKSVSGSNDKKRKGNSKINTTTNTTAAPSRSPTPTIVINDNSLDDYPLSEGAEDENGQSGKKNNAQREKATANRETMVPTSKKLNDNKDRIVNRRIQGREKQTNESSGERERCRNASRANSIEVEASNREQALQAPSSAQPPYPAAQLSHQANQMVNAGTAALVDIVFPHLAIVHQFALLNSDIQALELITKLGVHMQTQAADGAYKYYSLPGNSNNNNVSNTPINSVPIASQQMNFHEKNYDENITDLSADMDGSSDLVDTTSADTIYPDIDDIVLIE